MVTVLRPNDKSTYNPLYSSELRNKQCICGSGKKVKKCHGADPFILIETKDALDKLVQAIEQINEGLSKGEIENGKSTEST